MRPAALLTVLALAACEEIKIVDLSFGAGTRGAPVGFRCRQSDGTLLLDRAIDDRTLRFSLTIDFIHLGGLPTCRNSDIAAFCETHDCAPLATPERKCVPLAAPIPPSTEDNEEAARIILMGALLRSQDGQPVTDDAPSEPVIVRAVATAQPCEEVAGTTPFDPQELVGCAVSCPVQLGDVEGDVVLELPTLSDRCADGVVACATGTFSP